MVEQFWIWYKAWTPKTKHKLLVHLAIMLTYSKIAYVTQPGQISKCNCKFLPKTEFRRFKIMKTPDFFLSCVLSLYLSNLINCNYLHDEYLILFFFAWKLLSTYNHDGLHDFLQIIRLSFHTKSERTSLSYIIIYPIYCQYLIV